jgi:hypothetical protein
MLPIRSQISGVHTVVAIIRSRDGKKLTLEATVAESTFPACTNMSFRGVPAENVTER